MCRSCCGFGRYGVEAGSCASCFQSCCYGGSTPGGGCFAQCTSAGMKGSGSCCRCSCCRVLLVLLLLVGAGLAIYYTGAYLHVYYFFYKTIPHWFKCEVLNLSSCNDTLQATGNVTGQDVDMELVKCIDMIKKNATAGSPELAECIGMIVKGYDGPYPAGNFTIGYPANTTELPVTTTEMPVTSTELPVASTGMPITYEMPGHLTSINGTGNFTIDNAATTTELAGNVTTAIMGNSTFDDTGNWTTLAEILRWTTTEIPGKFNNSTGNFTLN